MKKTLMVLVLAAICSTASYAQDYRLNKSGYFVYEGIDAMAFNDFYPEGHQGGISLIMNGHRVFSNGDIRFDATPGQWQPVPKQIKRQELDGKVVTELCFPDSTRHNTGFNPMFYPDVQLKYKVTLEAQGKGLLVTVDLDSPIPSELIGRAGFNLEIFPGEIFGKTWVMDAKSGIYPQQPASPVIVQESYLDKSLGDFKPAKAQASDLDHLNAHGYSPYTADRIIAEPYAVGRNFTSTPEDPYRKFTIKSLNADMKLYDGRMNHNNGWFVLRSEIPAGATKAAIQWYIEPEAVPGWRYAPVVQTSQVGYLPAQQKIAVIETDPRSAAQLYATLVKYDADGEHVVKKLPAEPWNGEFLRYKYFKADFSDVKEEGLYAVKYADSCSPVFRIADDVYDRGIWQPVIEYFLPVQMCHMRVTEKYRVWHDRCHMDDARMAQPGNHIGGYAQQEDNMTHYKPGDIVENLNHGGWHDAGDFDLRVESQAGESYILSKAYEAFKPEIDATAIDQHSQTVEIHQPDGFNDVIQQIEHGALTVVNAYLALGRCYRGIICNTLRQYVMLGDAAAMTDGKIGNDDDRWVYTENNPSRELATAADLAASARVLKGHNDTLSAHCTAIAKALFEVTEAGNRQMNNKLMAAAELYKTTGEACYFDFIVANWDRCVKNVSSCAWFLTDVERQMEGNKKYKKQCKAFRAALEEYANALAEESKETPYGVPYKPSIWGAGWTIQSFGYRHYFLAKAYPEYFSPDQVCNSLHFILGRHPGINQSSFASGIGAQSATVGYGLNRADWSYIPGGVVSGTALIRPDFPELLVWPYLWQQVEYVLGGGSSHYMFLVLAAKDLMKQ